MIEFVEVKVTLKLAGKDPLDAMVRLDPGFLLYGEAGKLAAIEENLGLSIESVDGQCFKVCLSELFGKECFYSLREVLLKKLKEVE